MTSGKNSQSEILLLPNFSVKPDALPHRTPGNFMAQGDTVFTDQGIVIAYSVGGRRHKDWKHTQNEAEANARLFAASDKLLELAEAIVNGAPAKQVLVLAMSALAKARCSTPEK